jgi:hypothetical protein
VWNKLLTISFLLCNAVGFTQFGNEWIAYDQQYYSFQIHQDGVYKLDYTFLADAGVPVAIIAPENYQIFGFEQEQEIWVEGAGDGSFDPGDYILFYAQKNTTWLDSLMYDSPDKVSNRYYAHYNDTINYYLTWNASAANARINQELDVDFGAYAPTPYFLKTSYKEGHILYMEGYKVSGMSHSNYMDGEGWFGDRFHMAAVVNYQDDNLSTSNAFTGVGAPNAKGVTVSAGVTDAAYDGEGNHHLLLQYGLSNTILYDTVFDGYQKNKLSFELSPASLGATSTRIRHQLVNDLGVLSDYQAVAFSELIYAHTPNLEGLSYYELTIPFNPSATKTHYSFSSFTAAAPLAFTLGPEMKKIPIVETGGIYDLIVPNLPSGQDQDFVILDESSLLVPTEMNSINGTGYFTNFSSTDFESAYLLISHASLWDGAIDYKAYRESLPGGGHNVVLADVGELYHQFGGGVPGHVMAVRRYAHFAYTVATEKPAFLFLLGKGVREANENIATGFGTRQSSLAYDASLIPTFGYPTSDNLITARLEGNLWSPLIPTGRLAANTLADVYIYLNKVEEYELQQDPNSFYSVADKLWQKEVLHFGGGANEVEQSIFKYYLENYETDLEDSKFGGNITSYYKTVSDPVDPAILTDVTHIIDNGVSLMTFFGHASADGFDQNIDDPENWNNTGKYPIVVGNACLTGNIFEPTNVSASEEYVLIEDKGAIVFMANARQAFSNSLNSYSEVLFSNIADAQYGLSIGEQAQKTIELVQFEGMAFGLQNVCNQMTLHGDPAIKVNSHPKPELEINHSSIFFTPAIIDLTVDSIDVGVVVYNLGQSALDTFAIELTRSFPNGGGDSLYTKLVNGIDYIDTVVFTVPFYNNIGVGINTFTASVDIPSIVSEQFDEVNNNIFSKQVLFDVDGIYPVWPYNFAVIPDDTVSIKGSTVNPFADMANYRFEIDTTDLFNSPRHLFREVSSLGGVVEVEYNEWVNATSGVDEELILTDSTVYFWRVAVVDTGDYYWIENSFQYINGKSGWGQDHFFQFKNNDYLFLDYERSIRKRLFGPSFKSISCDVYGNATGWYQFAFTLFRIDGSLDPGYGEYNFCSTNPQFLVAVIDPYTLKSWGTRWDDGGAIPMQNPDHGFGNANDNGGCRSRVEDHFGFYQDNPLQVDAFENMMLNEIPDSFYYLIYTSRYANYSEWDAGSPDVYDVFTELGCDSIYPGREEVPFIVFGKMGDPSSTREIYGQYPDELIHLQDTLWGFDFYGEETSSIIGPSAEWEKLYWKQDAMETMTDDSTRLKVTGIGDGGSTTLLIDTLFTHNDSIPNLFSIIDADEYPYLQLNAEHWDSTGFTPAQIDRWHVLYQPAPEAALDGSAGVYWLPNDTLYEGQQIAVAFDIKNISNVSMDSLLVNYWIEDADHNLIPITYPRQDSLRVGQTIRDTLSIPTVNHLGFNSLWVEVNPYVGSGATDQLEQYHFNNIGQIPFNVLGDNENPILDVTFNGYHILNGDLIDPRSDVLITLKDENPYLIMEDEDDTANFGIYLTDPNGVQMRLNFRNSIGEPLMEWIPADPGNKKFKIVYTGDFKLNGTYRLLVQGVDKSGNTSGDFEYDIEFEVDHNSAITHLMNYPNPFSTSTQFVFTLSGATIPDEFTIQIMTVTGKVVREITKDELGDIRIGRNISEYRWNGTDEFGDALANGVYLYRVIVKIDNETIDHRESGADQYFTKQFGKMYLMR